MISHSKVDLRVDGDLRTFDNGYKPLPKLENTIRIRHKLWRTGIRGERVWGYANEVGIKGQTKALPMDICKFIHLHTAELLNASNDQVNNTITFDVTITEVSRCYQEGDAPCPLPIG